MKGKAFIPLALGLGMGLVAVKLLVDTLQKAKGSTDEKQTVTVVRATQDIGAFEKIAAEYVDVVETANNAFIPTNQRMTSLEDVIGRVTAKTIPGGTPVLQSMLAPPGTRPGMVGKIPKGFRAFSVKIDEVSGVAYQLKPGDWVDIIALMDVATGGRGGKKETISKIILENVQLAAMGRSTAGTQGDGTAAKMKPAKSATLLVPKDEIPKLHLWQTRGKLTLAMRGDDRETTDNADVIYRESEMHGAKKDAEPVEQTRPARVARVEPPPENQLPHSVTVYRGSPVSEQTEVQQVIFENPHSRNVVELRGGPVVQVKESGRRSQSRTRTPVPNTDRTVEPGVQGKPAFDDTEAE